MSHKTKTILFALFSLLLIAAAALGYNLLKKEYQPESGRKEINTPASDFTVYDAAGEAVSLSDFYGEPIVLNFWATWCPPCKAELPAFEAAADEYGGEIHFLMVNLTDGFRETQQTVETFLQDTGYTFPVYYDTNGKAALIYDVSSVPLTVCIDAQGIIRVRHVGMLDAETLEHYIGIVCPISVKEAEE